jgi:hypothetical protein
LDEKDAMRGEARMQEFVVPFGEVKSCGDEMLFWIILHRP